MTAGPMDEDARRSDPDEIPTPLLVAAHLALDVLPVERVPRWAAHWLAAGHHGDALVALAGLRGDDPHEVRDLLPDALAACGVGAAADPDAEQEWAGAMVAFTAVARAGGRASARWVVDQVAEIAGPAPPPAVAALPLGRLLALHDGHGTGLDPAGDRFATTVHRACAEQLDAARLRPR